MLRRTHILPAIALALLLAAGCADGETAEMDVEPDAAGDPTMAVNMLTEEERGEGWQLLFDGEDLGAWRGYRQDTIPPNWSVVDGAIYTTGEEGPDLITAEQFDDFEFSFEWKISEGGNSGVMYRVTEDNGQTYESGPEYQVLDDAAFGESVAPKNRSGSNYDLHAPTADAARPAGEWNQARIVVDSAHVEHWLNGQKVVEYELWSDEWEALVAGSKWGEVPTYGRARTGHLALQNHSDPVWYRNLKVRGL